MPADCLQSLWLPRPTAVRTNRASKWVLYGFRSWVYRHFDALAVLFHIIYTDALIKSKREDKRETRERRIGRQEGNRRERRGRQGGPLKTGRMNQTWRLPADCWRPPRGILPIFASISCASIPVSPCRFRCFRSTAASRRCPGGRREGKVKSGGGEVNKGVALEISPIDNLLRCARPTLIHLVFRNRRGCRRNLRKREATSRAHFSNSDEPIMETADEGPTKVATAIRTPS